MTDVLQEDLLKGAYDYYHQNIFSGVYDFASRKLWRHHPYLTFVLEGLGESYAPNKFLTLNSVGLRAPECPDQERYRICILGGCVTFGTYAPRNDMTIPGFMETMLNHDVQDRKFQTLNSGYSGHIITQHLILLHHILLEKYKPSMVICLAGYNDFLNTLADVEPGTPLQNEFPRIIRTMQTGSFPSIVKSVFLKTLMVRYKGINKLFNAIKATSRKRPGVLNSENEPGKNSEPLGTDESRRIIKTATHYVQTMGFIKSLLSELGIKFIAALQPALGYGGKTLTETEEQILGIYQHSTKNYLAYLKCYYDAINQQMQRLRTSQNFKWVNCASAFRDISRQIFLHSTRMGDIGNRIIAEQLKHELISMI